MGTYGSDVINLAYAYVRNYVLAQDITQEVFLKAYAKMDQFRGQSSVRTWLLTITANHCRDFLRSWAHRHEVKDDVLLETRAATEDTEREVIERMERDELWRLVHSLPARYREVLILFYQRGLTSAEVAEVLGLSEPSVRTRLHRARTILKSKLEGVR